MCHSLAFPSTSVPSLFVSFLTFPLLRPCRTQDSGLLSDKENLPVRSLVLGDVQRSGSEAAYRVGPLLCHGDSECVLPLKPLKPTR